MQVAPKKFMETATYRNLLAPKNSWNRNLLLAPKIHGNCYKTCKVVIRSREIFYEDKKELVIIFSLLFFIFILSSFLSFLFLISLYYFLFLFFSSCFKIFIFSFFFLFFSSLYINESSANIYFLGFYFISFLTFYAEIQHVFLFLFFCSLFFYFPFLFNKFIIIF